MNTSISNGSFNKNFAMVLGVVAGAVLLAVLAPIALNAVAPLACWKAMIGLFFGGVRYASLDAFAASLSGIDAGSVACTILMFAYPVHLLVRYVVRLFGKEPDQIALFGASATKWIAVLSVCAAAASLCMGLGAKWLLAASAAGDVDACNAALLVMMVGLAVLPVELIGWIVLSSMAAGAEPESLLANVDALGEHPLLAYPGAIVLTVVAMLSVIVPVAKVAIKVGWSLAKLAARLFALAMAFVLWLLSIFSSLV